MNTSLLLHIYIQTRVRFFSRFWKDANLYGCRVNLTSLNAIVSSADTMTGPRAAGSLSLGYNAAE